MVIASPVLMKLAKIYLAFVDRGEDSPARSEAHERVMAQMRLDGIQFADRIDAANLARDIMRLDKAMEEFFADLNELAADQNLKTIWRFDAV